MPNMDIVDGKYLLIQNIAASGTKTINMSTENKFVDKNVEIDIVTPAGAQTISGGTLSAGNSSISVSSDGYYNGSSYDTSDKVTLTTTEQSGYYKITGNGSVVANRAAVTRQVTTAGFFSTDADPVSVISADSQTVTTSDHAYFIKKSTLSASSVSPSTTAQTVTIGEGYAPADRTVTINAVSGGTAASSFANTGLSTYFNAGTSELNDVSITPQYSITSAGYFTITANPVDGTPSYYSIKTTSVIEGATIVSEGTATRGYASWDTGWITASSISAAVFANTATSGTTYVDISGTTDAPVLVSGDYLYINKGYVDNLKISLAKLVPDGSDVKDHGEYILTGHSAYDDDGVLVAGSMPVWTGAYTIA